jgi:hypothetical protein
MLHMRKAWPRLVRHEHRKIGFAQNLTRRAAKDKLADAALRIAAFDQKVGAAVICGR